MNLPEALSSIIQAIQSADKQKIDALITQGVLELSQFGTVQLSKDTYRQAALLKKQHPDPSSAPADAKLAHEAIDLILKQRKASPGTPRNPPPAPQSYDATPSGDNRDVLSLLDIRALVESILSNESPRAAQQFMPNLWDKYFECNPPLMFFRRTPGDRVRVSFSRPVMNEILEASAVNSHAVFLAGVIQSNALEFDSRSPADPNPHYSRNPAPEKSQSPKSPRTNPTPAPAATPTKLSSSELIHAAHGFLTLYDFLKEDLAQTKAKFSAASPEAFEALFDKQKEASFFVENANSLSISPNSLSLIEKFSKENPDDDIPQELLEYKPSTPAQRTPIDPLTSLSNIFHAAHSLLRHLSQHDDVHNALIEFKEGNSAAYEALFNGTNSYNKVILDRTDTGAIFTADGLRLLQELILKNPGHPQAMELGIKHLLPLESKGSAIVPSPPAQSSPNSSDTPTQLPASVNLGDNPAHSYYLTQHKSYLAFSKNMPAKIRRDNCNDAIASISTGILGQLEKGLSPIKVPSLDESTVGSVAPEAIAAIRKTIAGVDRMIADMTSRFEVKTVKNPMAADQFLPLFEVAGASPSGPSAAPAAKPQAPEPMQVGPGM